MKIGTPMTVAAKLAWVRQQVDEAARRVGRSGDEVTLVAVSKTHPIEAIAEAYAAGQRDFGENRLEELWPKIEQARQLGLDEIRWHLIGTIQSRKSANAIGPFALIHSVDTLKLANRLNRDAAGQGVTLDILLETNVSGEDSKHGFTPHQLLAAMPELLALESLRVRGLMTMAPLVDDAEETRPVFHRLRQLRDELSSLHPHAEVAELSMGMTNDFQVAVEEGATLVRVGSAIFGPRLYTS